MVTLSLKRPRKSCADPRCPFHGTLPIRGRTLEGKVVDAKMDKTAIIRRDYLYFVPKYKRYERRHSHIPAHNPPCINAKQDEKVRIAECRKLSKTVSFVIVEKVEKK